MQSIRHFSISKWYQSVFSIDRFELEAKKNILSQTIKLLIFPILPISLTMKLQRRGPAFSYFYIYFYNPDITGILTLLSMTNMESLNNVQVAQIYWHGHGRDLYTWPWHGRDLIY